MTPRDSQHGVVMGVLMWVCGLGRNEDFREVFFPLKLLYFFSTRLATIPVSAGSQSKFGKGKVGKIGQTVLSPGGAAKSKSTRASHSPNSLLIVNNFLNRGLSQFTTSPTHSETIVLNRWRSHRTPHSIPLPT